MATDAGVLLHASPRTLTGMRGCALPTQVPLLLVVLWTELVRRGGLETVGIFRTAPDAKAAQEAQRQLSKSSLKADCPPEALAHLIKYFLRTLPGRGLFGRVSESILERSHTTDGCRELLGALSTLERAILEWLVRVIVEVATRGATNKMNLRNLTLVLAPNLLVPDSGSVCNPMVELVAVERASNALHTLASASMRFSL